jgi:hypothetical protein
VLPPPNIGVSGSAGPLALVNFVAAMHAADEESEEQRFESYEDGSRRHLLERPMQVLLRLSATEVPRTLVADVLDYGGNGARLSVALPPELEVVAGQRGELRLLGADQSAGDPLEFTLLRLEEGSMVKLAELVITGTA